MNIFLIIAVLLGGHAPIPQEDDARVSTLWTVVDVIDGNLTDAMPTFEWSRSDEGKVLFVGYVYPQSITECNIGAHYFKHTRQWTPLRWECP